LKKILFFFDINVSHDIFLSTQSIADQQDKHKNNTSFMKKTIAAIVMGTVLAVGSTNAAIVFGNLGASGTDALDTSYRGLTSSSWAAIGFTPTGNGFTTLGTASLGLQGTGLVTLTLYSNVSNVPGSSLGFFDTQSFNLAAPALVTFTFNQVLPAGPNYWLVASSASGANWAANANFAVPTAQNASGWAWTDSLISSDSGGAWSQGANAGQISLIDALSANVSPIPEPGTWAAMAMFAAGAGYAGWRRRQQLSVA